MNHLLRQLLMAAALLGGAMPAWSTMTCSLMVNPAQAKGIYPIFPSLDVTGTFTVTCTRDPLKDPRRPNIWLGLNQPTTGRTATLDTGGSSLTYTVAHAGYASGIWTNTGGVAANSTSNQAVTVRLDFGAGGGATVIQTFSYYFRVAQLQIKPAGVYIDSAPITLLLGTTSAGTPLATGSLNVLVSIPKSCRFSTPPTPISVNYPAFSATAVTGTSNFAMTCTQGTTYTIALDATRGLIPNVQLSYGLTLSAGSSTGTAVSQPYTVNISVDAGQAGRCVGSTCSGTDSRTLTVTY